MPALKARLSKSSLEQLEQGAILWDEALPGFGARRAGGFVSYIYNYRVRTTGKMRRVIVGRDTEMTTSEARDRAVDLAAAVRGGADPAKVMATPKQRQKAGNTLGQAIEAWLPTSPSKSMTAMASRR